jgi:bla regulator protein BlaR1
MNFATMILPQQIVEALGWTLFHSLWQGALAALAFAVILYLSRRSSARLRYGLGLAVLALMLLVSVLTFRNHYGTAGAEAATLLPGTVGPARAATAVPSAPVAATNLKPSRSQFIVAFFSDYFSRNLPLIVTLWLLGVLFLTLRFTGGMLYLQRLKYKQSRPLPQPWPDRLRVLTEKAGLKRPLQLLESLRLRTPVVIGHLKPVLLLPVGLATGLPIDEVEALLAHELAHVLRRDYLVNVLQNLVEIIYFFHPGVRWISAGVRQEREHCCDDFAVALCGDAQNYARALARLQVSTAGSSVPFSGSGGYPEPALAAVGRPQRLLRRIVRLLAGPRLAHDFKEGFISALIMVACLFGVLKMTDAAVGGKVEEIHTVAENKPGQPADKKNLEDGVFAVKSFALKVDGTIELTGTVPVKSTGRNTTWIIDSHTNQVVWFLTFAGKKTEGNKVSFAEAVSLPHGDYFWYLPSGCAVSAHWTSGSGQREVLRLLENKEGYWVLDREQLRLKEEEALLKEEEERTRLKEQAMHENKQAMKEQQKKRQEAEIRSQEEMQRLKLEEERMRVEENHLQAGEMKLKAQLDKEKIKAEDQNNLAKLGQLKAEEKRLRAEENNFQALIRELAAAGLVNKSGRYEVRLSAAALLINNRKQLPAAHERIKKFYERQFNAKLSGERTIQIDNGKD